jgi:hypothetical protein
MAMLSRMSIDRIDHPELSVSPQYNDMGRWKNGKMEGWKDGMMEGWK